ncbi:MAG: Flp pilus assembly complex ATPase component TadA [Deltaproteobacteria bacterium]|nr:Flp pilus assembly complex ATPase component TadA [Deltaproteobacteria bacterium]
MAVKKIGELLVESGLITEGQLHESLQASKEGRQRLGAVIVHKGYATEMDIAQTLAFQLGIPFVDISKAQVDPEAVGLVPERLAKQHVLMPLTQEHRVLRVAMADPLNLRAIDDLRFSTEMEIQPSVATLSDIDAAINTHYHLNEPIEDLLGDLKRDRLVELVREPEPDRDIAENARKSAAPPIIKMVDSVLIHGYENRASDIHIEPQELSVKLRIRVDGIMRETMKLPKWVQGPVVSRIKLMSRMDIAERRVSQDGRFKVKLGDKAMDVRVSTLPTQYGETVVMRLLDPKSSTLELNSVGLLADDLARVKNIIERPQGVVLVTGPTGSGKTSTLYSMIGSIKSERINIITIEDPIEYELRDVNQVAVNEKTGLTFSYTLRSVLRQDPDVILVGEMRDAETAIIAHQASMTGHLVFSTLHTNDAVSSVVRLRNLGIPSYMIGSALNGVLAQRLVRKICSHCKEAYNPSDEELRKGGVKWSGKKLYRGAGCKSCSGSGYSGRVGIFEVLTVNQKVKNLISSDGSEQDIFRAAVDAGMTPMHMDGLKKVAAGMTTLDELTRVIYLGKEDDGARCAVCFESLPEGAPRCPSCGASHARNCPSCSKDSEAGWKVCPWCGQKLAKA